VTLTEGQLPGQLSFGAAPPAWHNVLSRYDVNGDDNIVPLDALLVINDLNTLGARTLPEPTLELQPPPYLDVNGDGWVSAIDALQLITELNSQQAGETGEPLFPLDFHVLAVAAEGEPPRQFAAAAAAREDADRVWAELRFTEDLRQPWGWEEVDIDGLVGREMPDNESAASEQLEEIIGDDLRARSWLEWSTAGGREGRGPGA
jgi:hypothetical protein